MDNSQPARMHRTLREKYIRDSVRFMGGPPAVRAERTRQFEMLDDATLARTYARLSSVQAALRRLHNVPQD